MDFVVLTGNNCVGKTTTAKTLQDVIHRGSDRRVAILSFSDALRSELVTLYGLPHDIVYDKTIDKKNVFFRLGDYQYDPEIPRLWMLFDYIRKTSQYDDIEISLRELFITHGSLIRRKQDPYYWSKCLSNKINDLHESINMVIVDDSREPDDLSYLTDKGAHIFHLVNGVNNEDDYAQQKMNEWLYNNPSKITRKINVPVPLLQFDAERICVRHIFPVIIPRRVSHKIYHDWTTDEESD